MHEAMSRTIDTVGVDITADHIGLESVFQHFCCGLETKGTPSMSGIKNDASFACINNKLANQS